MRGLNVAELDAAQHADFLIDAFGGALGPTVIGKTSDYFAHAAAANNGVVIENLERAAQLKALEPYKPEGLNNALFLLPIVSLLLAGTLFAGARTVTRDVDNLQRWMRESATSTAASEPRVKEKAVT